MPAVVYGQQLQGFVKTDRRPHGQQNVQDMGVSATRIVLNIRPRNTLFEYAHSIKFPNNLRMGYAFVTRVSAYESATAAAENDAVSGQRIDIPPSRGSVTPVMNLADGDARNTATCATSSA